MAKGLLGTADKAALAPEFQKIVAGIEVDDVTKRIVTAGMRMMYDPKTHKLLFEDLTKTDDVGKLVGQGAAGLVVMLEKKSKGTMPPDAKIKAAAILLADALDFCVKAGLTEYSPELVATATKAMTEGILGSMGITPEMLQNMMGNIEGAMSDPKVADAYIKYKQGEGA